MDEPIIGLAFAGLFSMVSLLMGVVRARRSGPLAAWPEFTVFGICAGIAAQNEAWSQWAVGVGAIACCLYIFTTARKKR